VGEEDGGGAGYVRSSHRCAAEAQVGVARGGAVGADAGGAEIDRGEAVVGETGECIGVVGGGDGDDVIKGVTGGVVGAEVSVGAVIAGGGDEELTGGTG
jgi:hypothetical protein